MWPQFPTELWLDILEECSQNDLVAFSQTCKHLHQLTERLLYSTFSWIPDQKRISWQGSPVFSTHQCLVRNMCPRVHLLLRTLLNRPELALHIKSAEFMSPLSKNGELKNILPFWSSNTKGASGFTPREFELAETIIREMEFSDEWLEGLRNGRSDVIIALLLSRLSEISSLDIRLRTSQYQPPIVGGTILEVLNSDSLISRSPRFKNLKFVSLSIDRDEVGLQTCASRMAHLYRFDRQVAPLFYLPSMKKLDLAWIHPEFPMGPSPVPIAQNLTTLIIRDSIIDESVLKILLWGTPHLEVLECGLTYDHFKNEHCDCQVLKSALDQVATTLRSLVIGIHVLWHGRLVDDWNIVLGSMGSMMHFEELRHLAVPLIMLMDSSNIQLAQVLPSRLEMFEVGWIDSRQYIQNVEWQLEEYLGEPSMLQAMKVNTSKNWSQSFREKLSKLPGNRDGDISVIHQLEPVLI